MDIINAPPYYRDTREFLKIFSYFWRWRVQSWEKDNTAGRTRKKRTRAT